MKTRYHIPLFGKLPVEMAERRGCVPLFARMLELSEQARREGLLSLEDGNDDYQLPGFQDVPGMAMMYRKSVQMIVDGMEPEGLAQYLESFVLAMAPVGKNLLGAMILTDGILGIQAGDNPRVLRDKMAAWVMEDGQFMKEVEDFMSAREKEEGPGTVEKFLIEREKNGGAPGELDRLIEALDDKGMQKVLREVANSELAIYIGGANRVAAGKIIHNMSERAAVLLVEDTLFMSRPSDEDQRKAVAKITGIIVHLEEDGEIVFDRSRFDES